jgi:photosystem II stability/assembly factor-like uncharacterized protein
MKGHSRVFGVFCFFATALLATLTSAQVANDQLLSGLKWRNIGPFHGGRVSAVSCAIQEPGTCYLGAPEGGIWKTTNAGVSWFPIFDQFTNVDSIGSIQVAPSDPHIIYAGTGDSVGGSAGDGMYKSVDGGVTWTHVGLDQTTKINKMVIDPRDPNIVVCSTQGDATHDGRGIYRTTDGGKTWENVLRPENSSGTRDIEYAFDRPNVIFATSQGLGGGFFGAPQPQGPNGTALFKSTDEGKTWKKVESLPQFTGRLSVAVAMNTDAKRVFVIANSQQGGSGLVRSDDGGETWTKMAANDSRISNGQGGYSSGVWVDSQNPDIVYTIATTVYRSLDGGKTFTAYKGAPGGEDPQVAWFDPVNSKRIFFGFDQGPAITLDGGSTWSGFYQIPIAQIYNISTDTRYPYWVMGSQQDTGAIMTRSRGDWGQVTNLDWAPLPSSEFGTVVPDPYKPTTVYGEGYGLGQGSGLIKIDLDTGQWGNVAPNFGSDRPNYVEGRDFWKRFDTAFEPGAMYVAYNCLMVTRDGGLTWKASSPDLTSPKGQPLQPCGAAPTPVATPMPKIEAPTPTPTPAPVAPRGYISDFAISTLKKGVVWTGSSTGQIYKTLDGGKTWENETNFPSDLPQSGPNTQVQFMTVEAGHSDINTAYVVANVGTRPGTQALAEANYIYRTHDGGKSWTRIVNGLPLGERTGSRVNVIREDPKQKGLLFAGTETTVYVSFDDGDHWQALRLNLPSTSIRDMVVHTNNNANDLVIGTYGRGFWVLDDISPLREIASRRQAITSAPAYLFKPGDAIRSRESANWDQPMNAELPHADNPPFGALIYYHLGKKPAGEIRMQVFDAAGNLVRTITSTPPVAFERAPMADYWLKPPAERALSTNVGTNRINWDLRYDDPQAYDPDIVNQMNPSNGTITPGPHGPLALPGTYTVKLTVDGQTYSQPLVVHNDPRVGESPAMMLALRQQNKLALAAAQGMRDTYAANEAVAGVRAQLADLMKSSNAEVASAATALDKKLADIGGMRRSAGRFGAPPRQPGSLLTFFALNNTFYTVLGPISQNGLDMAPTPSSVRTWENGCREFATTSQAWNAALAGDVAAFNALLSKNNMPALKLPAPTTIPGPCVLK